MPLVNFSQESIDKLNKLIGGNLDVKDDTSRKQKDRESIPPQMLFHAVAVSAIEAAGDGAPQEDATEFEFRFLIPDPVSPPPANAPAWNPGDDLKEDDVRQTLGTAEFKGYNRDPDFSLDADETFIIAKFGPEWRPVSTGGLKIFRTRPLSDHDPDTFQDHEIMDTDETGVATVRAGDPLSTRNETGGVIEAGDDCNTFKPDGSDAYFSFPWDTGCDSAHELTIEGHPVSGDFTWRYQIESIDDDIVIDFDSTAAEAEAAFETHSEISPGQVSVSGGPLPHVALYVSFIDVGVTQTPSLIGNSLVQDVDDPKDPQPKLRLRA